MKLQDIGINKLSEKEKKKFYVNYQDIKMTLGFSIATQKVRRQ